MMFLNRTPAHLAPAFKENLSAVRRCEVLHRHLSARGSRRNMQTNSSQNPEEVLYSKAGGVATVTLNRPKALNALNLNMLQLMTQYLKSAAADPEVKIVVVESTGGKAFCAGGDVRSLTEAGKSGTGDYPQRFFQVEYSLNYLTGTFPKPYVALQDGITMGGGVGISSHGPFRVATEYTLFAMPETALGLFPDVGGSHILPRLQGSLGMFLALTGQRLKSRDVVFSGIATHFVPRSQIPALKERLTSLCSDGGAVASAATGDHSDLVKQELDRLHQENVQEFPQEAYTLAPQLDIINRCFNQPSVEDILVALKREDSEWTRKQLQVLSKMSPTSLKITHRQLVEGAKLSFADCFKMEYRMSQGCMAGCDFYEGCRAILVDKDNKPVWNPPTLEEITPDIVDRHFAPCGSELILET